MDFFSHGKNKPLELLGNVNTSPNWVIGFIHSISMTGEDSLDKRLDIAIRICDRTHTGLGRAGA